MMYSEDYARAALEGLRKPIPEMALDASVNARITLMAGSLRCVSVGSGALSGCRAAQRKSIAEWFLDRGMLVAVHAIGATGGHCDETGYREGALGPETWPGRWRSECADEARRAVRLAHKYGATVIKTCATGGVLSLADAVDTPQLTQAETGRAGGRSACAEAKSRRATRTK